MKSGLAWAAASSATEIAELSRRAANAANVAANASGNASDADVASDVSRWAALEAAVAAEAARITAHKDNPLEAAASTGTFLFQAIIAGRRVAHAARETAEFARLVGLPAERTYLGPNFGPSGECRAPRSARHGPTARPVAADYATKAASELDRAIMSASEIGTTIDGWLLGKLDFDETLLSSLKKKVILSLPAVEGSASFAVLKLAVELLPPSARLRWLEEWCGELQVLDGRYARMRFSMQVLRGIPKHALTLWSPFVKRAS
jgi:hypothetical protein